MTYKYNIVKCENCGKEFNNFYRKTRWTKIGCSRLCQNTLKRKFYNQIKKERRHKLRAEHKCIVCATIIKPIIVYPRCCEKHKPKKKNEKTIEQKINK